VEQGSCLITVARFTKPGEVKLSVPKKQNDEVQIASGALQKKKAGQLIAVGKQLLFSLIIFVAFFGGIELILALSGVKPILLTKDL
jgi:hypothetical protein